MKKIAYISFAVLLLFGCRKNEDITEISIDVPDPSELGGVGVDGRLVNEFDEPVVGVSVDLYRAGEELGTTTTDAEGKFRFDDIPYQPDPIYVWTKVDGIHRTYKSFEMSGTPEDEVEFSLETTLHTPLADGTLTDFILTKGQIEDANGEATRGKFVIFNQSQEIFSYGESDKSGRYEAISPSNQAFSLLLLDWCGNVIRQESFNAQTGDMTLAQVDIAERGIPVRVSGKLRNSQGQIVPDGFVVLHYGDVPRTVQVETDNEGNFSYRTFSCLLGSQIVCRGFNAAQNQVSPRLNADYTGGDADFGVVATTSFNQFNITYNYKGEQITYKDHYISTGFDSNGTGTNLLKGGRVNQISFEINDLNEGITELNNLRIVHENPDLSAVSSFDQMFLSITEYNNLSGRISATFTGNFTNETTGENELISGELTLPVF